MLRQVSHSENRLLAALPEPDYQRFMERSRHVRLDAGDALARAGEDFHDVYFPTAGMVSMLSRIDNRSGLEVGLVGNEGMVGAAIAVDGYESPTLAHVQGVGDAVAMGVSDFYAELEASAALHGLVKRYLQVVLGQLGRTAVCLRFHRAGPRLARWLLSAHDRLGDDTIEITHEQLAGVLGIRRVGVTGAASNLQRRGLISYQRGQLTIRDRTGLEGVACNCYAADVALYTRLMRL